MMRDSRLSGILHVLVHLAEAPGPVTSEAMARSLATNPVVIRRLLAGLRARGHVASEKGHGGGWRLVTDPAALSLREIHAALGEPALFAIGNRQAAPACLVEQAVNAVVDGTLRDAEALVLARLEAVSLADLAADVAARQALRAGPERERGEDVRSR